MRQNDNIGFALQLISQGRYAESEKLIAELITVGSDLPNCFYGLGIIRLSSGQLELATEQFQKCINLDPHHANAFYYLGDISERRQDNTKAHYFYARALEINSAHAGAIQKFRPSSQPPQTLTLVPTSTSPQIVPTSSDLYALFRESSEPVEQEISRHLDAIASRIGTRRPRARAFIGLLQLILLGILYPLGARGAFVITEAFTYHPKYPQTADKLELLAVSFLLSLVPFSILVGLLMAVLSIRAKSSMISCERDWLLRTKGLISTSVDSFHLFLLSRGKVSYHQTFANRLTNDGTLSLGDGPVHISGLHLRGYFRKPELEELAAHFRQLSLLNPTSRNILAALGELKQIRSGSN